MLYSELASGTGPRRTFVDRAQHTSIGYCSTSQHRSGCTDKLKPGPHKKKEKKRTPMHETVILVSAQLCPQYLILCDLIPPQSAVPEHTPRSFSRIHNRTGCTPKLKPGPHRLRRMKLQVIHNCVNTNSFIRCNPILHTPHSPPGTLPRTPPLRLPDPPLLGEPVQVRMHTQTESRSTQKE